MLLSPTSDVCLCPSQYPSPPSLWTVTVTQRHRVTVRGEEPRRTESEERLRCTRCGRQHLSEPQAKDRDRRFSEELSVRGKGLEDRKLKLKDVRQTYGDGVLRRILRHPDPVRVTELGH